MDLTAGVKYYQLKRMFTMNRVAIKNSDQKGWRVGRGSIKLCNIKKIMP